MDAHRVPASHMENTIRATHSVSQAVTLGDVTLANVNSQLLESDRAFWSARQRRDHVTRIDELTHQVTANKTGCPSHEVPSHFLTACPWLGIIQSEHVFERRVPFQQGRAYQSEGPVEHRQ